MSKSLLLLRTRSVFTPFPRAQKLVEKVGISTPERSQSLSGILLWVYKFALHKLHIRNEMKPGMGPL